MGTAASPTRRNGSTTNFGTGIPSAATVTPTTVAIRTGLTIACAITRREERAASAVAMSSATSASG